MTNAQLTGDLFGYFEANYLGTAEVAELLLAMADRDVLDVDKVVDFLRSEAVI